MIKGNAPILNLASISDIRREVLQEQTIKISFSMFRFFYLVIRYFVVSYSESHAYISLNR